MKGEFSRRLEGQNQIIRTHKEEHMNTISLPYQSTIQSVPYYSRRKRQLKLKNHMLKKDDQIDRRSSQLSLSRSLQNQSKKTYHNMITQISVQPVINDNKFTNFDIQKYPLAQSQKVKVVQQKYFPLQNYYNYIWAVKSTEEIFKLAQQTQKKAKQVLEKKNIEDQFSGQYFEGDYDQYHKKGPIKKETIKIKGFYESRFNQSEERPSRRINNQGINNGLSPFHQNNYAANDKRVSFTVKQCDRQKIINESNKKK